MSGRFQWREKRLLLLLLCSILRCSCLQFYYLLRHNAGLSETSHLWVPSCLVHCVLCCCSDVNHFYSVWIWKGSVRNVAFFMLDKVPAPELITATVESCILPYTEEHQIPFDELLLHYIKVKFHHFQIYRNTSVHFSKCLLIRVPHSSNLR